MKSCPPQKNCNGCGAAVRLKMLRKEGKILPDVQSLLSLKTFAQVVAEVLKKEYGWSTIDFDDFIYRKGHKNGKEQFGCSKRNNNINLAFVNFSLF